MIIVYCKQRKAINKRREIILRLEEKKLKYFDLKFLFHKFPKIQPKPLNIKGTMNVILSDLHATMTIPDLKR